MQCRPVNRLVVFSVTLCLCGSALSLSAADPTKKPARITYDDHVLPVLKDKCVGCHNQDKKRGGLVLNNFTRLMEGGSSGVAVKPGDPDNSLLYKAIAHTAEPFMPAPARGRISTSRSPTASSQTGILGHEVRQASMVSP